MRKYKTIAFILCLLVISTSLYLNYSITTYSKPQIEFISSNNSSKPIKFDAHLTCFKQQKTVPAIEKNHFQLLVWNIHKAGDPGWQQALQKYAQNADFLLLQESTPDVLNNTKLNQKFDSRLYASSFTYLNKSSGVSIFSRFNPSKYCAGLKPEPWIKIPKVGVAEFFPLKNHQTLLVINIHAINFELNPTNYHKQISELLETIHTHQGPIILAGDFNAWNTYRHHFLQKIAKKYHLTEVTFKPDYRLRFWGNPLDYVFVRGINVENATTEQTKSSDHNPLLLKLSLKAENP